MFVFPRSITAHRAHREPLRDGIANDGRTAAAHQALLPPTAAVNRWLASSSLSVTTTAPAPSSDTGGYTAISSGNRRTCVVRTDGTIAC